MKVNDILAEDGKSLLKQAYTKAAPQSPAAPAPVPAQPTSPQQAQPAVQQTQQIEPQQVPQQPVQQLPQVDPQFQQQQQAPADDGSEMEGFTDLSHLFGKMPVGQAQETDLRNLALTFAAIAKQHNKLGAAPDKKVLYKGGTQSAGSAMTEIATGRIEVKTNYTLHNSVIGDTDLKGPIAMIIGSAFGQQGNKEQIMKIIIEQCKKAFRENVSHADSVIVDKGGITRPGKYRLMFTSGHTADVLLIATQNKPVNV